MDICPAPGAITRTTEGAVVFNQGACIGCKLCVAGCPFDVPRFDKDGKISKCTLCADRISNGLHTACSKVCPTGAIKYGGRDNLIDDAKSDGFDIYGEKDLKGLGVMFALKEDYKNYDLPKPMYSGAIAFWDSLLRPLSVLGFGAVGAGALLHYLTVGPNDVEPDEKEGGE
jgi:formate dehydrogenase iron-sulfur subunit